MPDQNSDDSLRVGTPERERAISLLNDAFANGYLDVSEFEERSGQIYGARTRGELRVALRDLPEAGLLFPSSATSVSHVPATGVVPAIAPAEFDAHWETLRRKGIWDAPQRMLVTGTMGTVDLDFTNATLAGPLIDLQLQMSTSTVKLRVGPDQQVRYDDLKKTGLSTVKDKAGEPNRSGGALIVISGSISAMSAVTIKRS